MIDKALMDIARRAVARRAPRSRALRARPALHAAASPATAAAAHAQQQSHTRGGPSSQLLDEVDGAYDRVLRHATLERRLTLGTESSLSERSLGEQTLLFRCQQLPHGYAMEAVGVLLRAGRADDAVQLVTGWHEDRVGVAEKPQRGRGGRRPYALSRRAQASACAELARTVDALRELKDAETLRTVAELLEASLAEQLRLDGSSLVSSTGRAPYCWCPPQKRVQLSSYRLLAPLGPHRTYTVLARTVAAMCALDDDAGLLLSEKLAWVGKASAVFAQVVGDGDAHAGARAQRMPPSLQRTFAEVLERDVGYTEELLCAVAPRLPSAMVHPSQYAVHTTLQLPASEARAALHELQEQPRPRESDVERTGAGGLFSLVGRFFETSAPLRRAEVNRTLLTCLVGSPAAHAGEAGHAAEVARARVAVVDQLRSREPAVRRAVSAALLRHRRVLAKLRISPTAVLAEHAGAFYSVGHVSPRMSRLCFRAIPALVRRGREGPAARLAWNHLSVQSPANVRLFRSDPRAMDAVTVAMCRTMRRHALIFGPSARSMWMGHRSLALLRVANAADVVTPLHVVVSCASALDVGVHFAAVQEFIEEVYRADPGTGEWALNCIRVCADVQDEHVRVRLTRRSLPDRVREVISRWCDSGAAQSRDRSRKAAQPFLTVQAPSRSKQLALWAAVNDPQANPRLVALTMALFLDAGARDALLNCDALAPRPQTHTMNQQQTTNAATSAPPSARTFFAWEVAASMAANCSNESTYVQMLRTLEKRCALTRTGLGGPTSDNTASHTTDGPFPMSRHGGRLRELLQTEVDYQEDHTVAEVGTALRQRDGSQGLPTGAVAAGL